MSEENKQCQAITNNGEQCSRPAKDESDFFGTHAQPKLTPELSKVKLVVRYLSKTLMPQGDAWLANDVEAYLTSYIDLGYRLVDTHYVGENPDGYGICFILTREPE